MTHPDIYEQSTKAAPFLKWAGGKRGIMAELQKRLPKKIINYYEPFVGGGALFFQIHKDIKRAFLSDKNLDLTVTYNTIKKTPENLIEILKKHARLHCKEYYYWLRERHSLEDQAEMAARMIYLNKTCYNGLWRVNKKGEFNVPIGVYVNPAICQEKNIFACCKALRKATIRYQNYAQIKAGQGDFVYLDPPYHPITATSFTSYAVNGFTEKNQADLARFCAILHGRGAKIMISNSKTKLITDLYSSAIFKIEIVTAPRAVNCKGDGRKPTEEVLITNY